MLDDLLATEDAAYAQFETALLGKLRGWRRVQGTTTLTLPAYLATSPHGDERPVVDPLTRDILLCLGYENEHIAYNESLLRGFPDYQVRLSSIPGNTVFIVENKATNIGDFTATRGDDSESPLAQLQRYVLASGSYARLGLLCNGRVLEGWEIGIGERHLLFQLDLVRLASGGELLEVDRETMRGLFLRCARVFFEGTESLLNDAVRSVHLSDEDVRAIWDECAAERDLDRLRTARAERMEAVWRKSARSAKEHADAVVRTLEQLIALLEADVRSELEAALSSSFEATRRIDAEPTILPEALATKLRLHRSLFNLDEARYSEALLQPLERYFEDPGRYNAAELIENLRTALRPHIRRATELPAEGVLEMFGAETAGPLEKKGKASSRDRIEKAFAAVMHLVNEAILAADEVGARRREIETSYRNAISTSANFEAWRRLVTASVLTGETDEALRREFARQTAYVYVIRLLLVRICEDKGVLKRKLSDGALVMWQEDAKRYLDYASGRSHDYLCQMAYECAANLYAHFFASATLFDWYRLDEKLLLRAILALNTFRFDEVADDLIGTAYSNYLRAGKHAQGRYYTRRPVVETMLDTMSYTPQAAVASRLGDLSCGSGSFLVGAARRIIDAYRDSKGHVSDDKAADVVRLLVDNLYGIDTNPFACYLAETNLLIQSLDLLVAAERAGKPLRIERFHIYCADALIIDPHARPDLGAHLGAIPAEVRTAEAMKARLGDFSKGFDFLIGNPPYVRADDRSPSLGRFRDAVEDSGLYECLSGRWDLYVPFVELYARLLADNGRACMITIESLGSAPYAAKLREKLCTKWTLDTLLFADKLKLFPDANWQSNRIFVFRSTQPTPEHRVSRLRATGLEANRLAIEPLDSMRLDAGPARVFSLLEALDLDTSKCIPLQHICYVAYGMRLNATDKFSLGQVVEVPKEFDAESFGWDRIDPTHVRFKPFLKAAVVRDEQDHHHQRSFIDSGDDLASDSGIEAYHWLEWGQHTRIPQFAYRETVPERFDLPKLLIGKFSGAYWDEGARIGHVAASDGLTLAVRWCEMKGVEDPGLNKEIRATHVCRAQLEERSQDYSLGYLLALYLSAPVKLFIESKADMKKNIYPGLIKEIPVPAISHSEQIPFVTHAQRLQELAWRLYDLRREGVRITASGKVTVPVATWTARILEQNPRLPRIDLFQASATLFEFTDSHTHHPLAGARARGIAIVAGKEVVARIRPGIESPEKVAGWLAAFLAEIDGTFATVQHQAKLPRDLHGIQRVMEAVVETEKEVRRILDERGAIREDIDDRAWALYGRSPPARDEGSKPA